MRIFCVVQGRTRVYGEAYSVYVAAGTYEGQSPSAHPRRTPYNAKKTIYDWALFKKLRNGFSIQQSVDQEIKAAGYDSETKSIGHGPQREGCFILNQTFI